MQTRTCYTIKRLNDTGICLPIQALKNYTRTPNELYTFTHIILDWYRYLNAMDSDFYCACACDLCKCRLWCLGVSMNESGKKSLRSKRKGVKETKLLGWPCACKLFTDVWHTYTLADQLFSVVCIQKHTLKKLTGIKHWVNFEYRSQFFYGRCGINVLIPTACWLSLWLYSMVGTVKTMFVASSSHSFITWCGYDLFLFLLFSRLTLWSC